MFGEGRLPRGLPGCGGLFRKLCADSKSEVPPISVDLLENEIEVHLLRSRLEKTGQPELSEPVDVRLLDELRIEEQNGRQIELGFALLFEPFRQLLRCICILKAGPSS